MGEPCTFQDSILVLCSRHNILNQTDKWQVLLNLPWCWFCPDVDSAPVSPTKSSNTFIWPTHIICMSKVCLCCNVGIKNANKPVFQRSVALMKKCCRLSLPNKIGLNPLCLLIWLSPGPSCDQSYRGRKNLTPLTWPKTEKGKITQQAKSFKSCCDLLSQVKSQLCLT